jgi:hypothetical protein
MTWKQRGRNFLDTLKCYASALFLGQGMLGRFQPNERSLAVVAEMNICLQSEGSRVNRYFGAQPTKEGRFILPHVDFPKIADAFETRL